MARRIVNRKDLRADYEAAERRKQEEEVEDEDEEEEDEEESEEEDEGDAEDSDEEDEEAPKKKKKKVVKEVKPKPRRSRAAKATRLKAFWVVFDNSHRKVATFDYPKREEAEEHAKKLTTDKKNTHFVQLIKEQIKETVEDK